MRLLWEEDLFGAIGAIIVAASSLAAVWVVLEGLMQLPGLVSVLLASLAAVGILETISRRHYANDSGKRSAWSA